MELPIVNFETAKKLKEIGFDIKTHNYYSKDKYEREFALKEGWNDVYWGENYYWNWNTEGEPFKPFNKDCYSTPTLALIQMWLREKYDIIIDVSKVGDDTEDWHWAVNLEWSYFRGTYNEALEAGINAAVELLLNQK